jgi:hypothetical protein
MKSEVDCFVQINANVETTLICHLMPDASRFPSGRLRVSVRPITMAFGVPSGLRSDLHSMHVSKGSK